MYTLENLKYNKLYKKQFIIPFCADDRRRGSAILLFSPNYQTSRALMNNQFVLDRMRLYTSYFIERDIMYTINNENHLLMEYPEYNSYGAVVESATEPFIEDTGVTITGIDKNDCSINELYCQLGDRVIFFNELYDMDIFDEAVSDNTLNTKYRTMLYNDRLRNNKAVIQLYDQVLSDNPWLKKAYPVYSRYKRLNLYIDMYYYNQSYLKNNTFSLVRSVDMYMEFMNRFLHDKRISEAGYKRITVFLPVYGWEKVPGTLLYDFKKNLNPFSVIYKKMRLSPSDLKKFDGIEFIIFGQKGYFKFRTDLMPVNFHTKYRLFIDKLENGEDFEDDAELPESSSDAIATSIIDDIEHSSGAKINNITGQDPYEIPKVETDKQVVASTIKKHPAQSVDQKIDNIKTSINKAIEDTNAAADKEAAKAMIVRKVKKAAEESADKNEALDKLDADEDLKKLLADLQEETDSGTLRISATRANRINKANDALLKKQFEGKSIREILNQNKPAELPETKLPINSINPEWQKMKAMNYEKVYDLDSDLIKCLYSFADTKKMFPIAILGIDKEDTSTSEDSIYTYTVKCEGYNGDRFQIKFDIPKFRDNRFMRLRGNEKIFSIEMPLLPISKTSDDTSQIVSFYTKIMVQRYNTAAGKSNAFSDRLIKTLNKYNGTNIKISRGDNSRICENYDLPIDYIDLASVFNKIEYKSKAQGQKITIFFNLADILKIPGVSLKNGIPLAMNESGEVIYYTTKASIPISLFITNLIDDHEFERLYNQQSILRRCTYSRAKMANTYIPIIVVLAHDLGLTKAMDLAKIEYELSTKRDKSLMMDSIPLKDGFINYKINYYSMMLMNGLKDCETKEIAITDLNKKQTWIEQLNNFGGRQKSDSLDVFRDLMYDPVTVEVARDYKLPDNYHEALIYASNLLVDNKFAKHTDLSTNRYRTNEVVAARFYQVMCASYTAYMAQAKRNRKAKIFMKRSAVIDSILTLNTTSDLSVFQALLEIETKNTISTKGSSGLNEERSYTLDKRGFDSSMSNIISQSTSFAGNAGVNKQTTIDANILSGRGYFKSLPMSKETASVTSSMSMTESLSPYMLTSDDMYRNEMSFVQTAKHSTPIEHGSPQLVTTGADQAMPYLSSDMFAFKAKANGIIKEITPEYMLIEYADKTTDYIVLSEQTMKNSDGGFFIVFQLITDKKVGQRFKEGEVLAWDKKSYSKKVGFQNLSYNMGCLAKVAVQSDENAFEDSGTCSEWLSEAMSSDIVLNKTVTLNCKANLLYIVDVGQSIREGEPMLIFQDAFEDDDANALLKNLNIEDGDITTIGKSVVRSKVTGVISDIKLYRTCDIADMTEGFQKLFKKHEGHIKKLKAIAKNSRTDVRFDSDCKLEPLGKLKNAENSIVIEIFMKYHDKLKVGKPDIMPHIWVTWY